MTDMTPAPETVAPKPSPKPKKPAKAKAAPAAPKLEPPVVEEAMSEFAGMTTTKCADACAEKGVCVISTVNFCKHPCTTGDAGCGPITMANRAKAMKFIKHLQVDKA